MPYVFVEEVPDGEEEANVVPSSELDELQAKLDELEAAAEKSASERDALEADKTSLLVQLDDAKRKFADAFLSSREPHGSGHVKETYKPSTFASLFDAGKGA